MALVYSDGSPVSGRVTPSDMAREPRSTAVVAWFDGWGQANGMGPMAYPRRLDASEVVSWREGFTEGLAERREYEACGFDADKRRAYREGL